MATYDLLGVYYSLSRTFIPLKESFRAQKLAAEPSDFQAASTSLQGPSSRTNPTPEVSRLPQPSYSCSWPQEDLIVAGIEALHRDLSAHPQYHQPPKHSRVGGSRFKSAFEMREPSNSYLGRLLYHVRAYPDHASDEEVLASFTR